MTRGLLSCNTCCMLFGQLYDGRCATCANRWAALTNQPLPVPLTMPENLKIQNGKIDQGCRSCHKIKQRSEIPNRKSVVKRHRGWCFSCIDADKLEREQKHEIKMQKIKSIEAANAHRYNPSGRECTRCFTFKSWDNFHLQSSGANGRNAICKSCKSAAKKMVPLQ